MYKFWMYYLGTPNNVGQDPPLFETSNKLNDILLKRLNSSICKDARLYWSNVLCLFGWKSGLEGVEMSGYKRKRKLK